jgi:uncharacterized protein DUF3310
MSADSVGVQPATHMQIHRRSDGSSWSRCPSRPGLDTSGPLAEVMDHLREALYGEDEPFSVWWEWCTTGEPARLLMTSISDGGSFGAVVEFGPGTPDVCPCEAQAQVPSAGSGKQVGGTHYEDMPIMPFAIIDAFGLDFYGGNALKYLLRTGRKPGADRAEELRKARHYLDEMIQRAEKS